MRPQWATSGTAAEELAYSRQNKHDPLSEGIVQLGAAWFAVSKMETVVEPNKYHKKQLEAVTVRQDWMDSVEVFYCCNDESSTPASS
uniref:Uncharacterized protein n=1 Tax=Caenorhabditis japonica TaxID=281687 RepID=A0A8R1HVK2_CAEJA